MIEWHKPTRGRAATGAYIGIGAQTSTAHAGVQLVLRFSSEACKDLRLIEGDRVVIGFDATTKQICFKRVADSSGYKLSGKSSKSLTVTATISGLKKFSILPIAKDDVTQEGTHVALFTPTIFQLLKVA